MADKKPPGKNNKPLHKAPRVKSARRNLFGRDPDIQVEDLAKDGEDMSRRQESNFSARWNFDLSSCRPIPGKYEWANPVLLDSPTPLLHVPESGNTSDRQGPCSGGASSERAQDLKVTSPSDSLSSGEFSQSVAGSSSDDMSSPSSSTQSSSLLNYKPLLKRQRSSLSSDENDENHPCPKSPKR